MSAPPTRSGGRTFMKLNSNDSNTEGLPFLRADGQLAKSEKELTALRSMSRRTKVTPVAAPLSALKSRTAATVPKACRPAGYNLGLSVRDSGTVRGRPRGRQRHGRGSRSATCGLALTEESLVQSWRCTTHESKERAARSLAKRSRHRARFPKCFPFRLSLHLDEQPDPDLELLLVLLAQPGQSFRVVREHDSRLHLRLPTAHKSVAHR